MISEVVTSKGTAAVTSDQWHVVHAHFTDNKRKRPFLREIVSEHDDRVDCGKAAKALRATLNGGSTKIPESQQDEVFICRPNYKSLKLAKARKTKPRMPDEHRGNSEPKRS